MGLEVHAPDASDVDLVQDGVVDFDRELFFACFDGQLNAGLFSKLFVVLRRHHVLGTDGQTPVGQTVQRAKEREVGLVVEVRKLLDGPVARFGGRLLGKGKVADLHRVHVACQLLLNNAQ